MQWRIWKGEDKRRKETEWIIKPVAQKKRLSITTLHVVYDSLSETQDCTRGLYSLIQKGEKKNKNN